MSGFLMQYEMAYRFGDRVHPTALVSRDALLIGDDVRIGAHSRVDANTLLSGRIRIGEYVHIAYGVALFGKAGITFEDFTSMGAYGVMLSESDAFDGSALVGPTIPHYALSLTSTPIVVSRYAAMGARVTVLPGGGLAEGTAVGAHALVTSVLPEWTICVGTPAKPLKPRARHVLPELATLVRMGHRDGEPK